MTPAGTLTAASGYDEVSRSWHPVLWTKSAEEIFEQIRHDLDELPHQRGIVVTSAGVMTPLCKPETIKEVAELVKGYSVNSK